MEIIKQLSTNLKEKPQDSQLGFGKIFTDHMFMMNYTKGKGWHDARIVPYGPLSLDPACQVLHYSQEIFEGLKCYRTKDNNFQLFRPKDNFERMNISAQRMGMAEIDVDLAFEGLMALLEVEKEWTPKEAGTSLYIRPTMIATDNYLGVNASETYLFYIILSPSGAYYSSGLAPISIYVEEEYVRAVRGGVGFAKTGGNYASSIQASKKAKEKGCAQVLWLDGVSQRYIEEVGAMNMMFVYGNNKIVTPALNGSILSGITRKSVLALAEKMGYTVSEERMDIEKVIEDCRKGLITEAFGTGTAAVISPVDSMVYKNEKIQISDGIGSVTMKLYKTLTDLQCGEIKDEWQWIVPVK